jgi:hypothetical protein
MILTNVKQIALGGQTGIQNLGQKWMTQPSIPREVFSNVVAGGKVAFPDHLYNNFIYAEVLVRRNER